MSPIEKKLNAVMRAMTAENGADHEAAMREIRAFLESPPVETGADPDIRSEIVKALMDLGVPGHLKGYPYLITAIEAAVNDPGLVHRITKELYPIVAKAHDTTKSRTERAIRHAIESGWDRCDLDAMKAYFGNTISPLKGKPTNGEYIARVADVVRQRVGK